MKKKSNKTKKLKLYLIPLTIIVLIIITIYFCNNQNEVNIIIANEKYTFSKNDSEHEINLITLNKEFDTIVEKESIFSNVKVNGKKIFISKNIGIQDINSKNKIEIEIKFKGNKKYTKYLINTLPTTMPKYSTKGTSKTKGDFYFTTYGSSFGKENAGAENYIIKMNNQGKIIFYRKAGYKSYVFKKEHINNETYYTYLDQDTSNERIYLYILNSRYKLIKKIENIANTDKKSIDFHDYLLIDLNNYIFSDINKDASEVITEIKDNKIIWEYKIQSKEIEDIDKAGNKLLIRMDNHFNSFELDSDNNLLVSFRNSNEIIKINRKTGKRIWTLGGKNNDFDKNIFARQHSIVREKNTYMVFNNNNKSLSNISANKGIKSSVVIFKLNQKNKEIKNIKKYDLDCYSHELGSIWPSDIDNNIYVVDYGRSENKGKKVFEEINLETKEVYFTFEYPDKTSAAYRTYKY